MEIGVIGPRGRMGRALINALAAHDRVSGIRGLVRPDDVAAGSVEGGAALYGPGPAFWEGLAAVIDFTAPATTLAMAEAARDAQVAHVIGTTGLTAAETSDLKAAADGNRCVFAPNMALGVTLLMALVEQAARALGPDWDIEIVEMHHRQKADAPSGTALGLGQAAAAGRSVALDEVQRLARAGVIGPRQEGEIGFATLRGGDIVGDHAVHFATTGERLTLSHRATDRGIFARGAVTAALWVQDQPAGFYTMRDVLGLR